MKQLEPLLLAGRPLVVAPVFTVEPLPELYARLAAAFRFVRERLTGLIGEDGLRSVQVDGVDGYNTLAGIESLFLGAEATARAELGQESVNPRERAVFAAFARAAKSDPDLATDMRVAVPLYFDLLRERVRIAATVGLETRTLRFDWVKHPTVSIFGARAEPSFYASKVSNLTPITVECDVRVAPTREEFLAICDREKTVAAIREALVRS